MILHLISTANLGDRLVDHDLYFAPGDMVTGSAKQIYQLLNLSNQIST